MLSLVVVELDVVMSIVVDEISAVVDEGLLVDDGDPVVNDADDTDAVDDAADDGGEVDGNPVVDDADDTGAVDDAADDGGEVDGNPVVDDADDTDAVDDAVDAADDADVDDGALCVPQIGAFDIEYEHVPAQLAIVHWSIDTQSVEVVQVCGIALLVAQLFGSSP